MRDNFTKSDLKTGMVVQCKNKQLFLVIGNKLVDSYNHLELKDYDEDLIDRTSDNVSHNFDIDKVFKIKSSYVYKFSDVFKEDNLAPIWERVIIKYMTMEEMKNELEVLTNQKIEIIDKGKYKIINDLETYCRNHACNGCLINKLDGNNCNFSEYDYDKLQRCHNYVFNKTQEDLCGEQND